MEPGSGRSRDIRCDGADPTQDSIGIAALTAALNSVVDQLEAELAERRVVRQETAARIRELRSCAERLLGPLE